MGHPFARNAGKANMRHRVNKILKASGGGVGADESPFSKAGIQGRKIGTSAVQPEIKAEGSKSRSRFAKGGKVKKGHTTNIAIVVPHHPAMGGAAMGAGAPPMVGPGLPPGAGMPPGMLPGAPVPGMGGMPPPSMMPRARGGRLPTAGAGSGIGREQKAEWSKRHHE